MYLTLFIGIIGAYVVSYKGRPTLTKHIIENFLADMRKLHYLLMDDNSILERK